MYIAQGERLPRSGEGLDLCLSGGVSIIVFWLFQVTDLLGITGENELKTNLDNDLIVIGIITWLGLSLGVYFYPNWPIRVSMLVKATISLDDMNRYELSNRMWRQSMGLRLDREVVIFTEIFSTITRKQQCSSDLPLKPT